MTRMDARRLATRIAPDSTPDQARDRPKTCQGKSKAAPGPDRTPGWGARGHRGPCTRPALPDRVVADEPVSARAIAHSNPDLPMPRLLLLLTALVIAAPAHAEDADLAVLFAKTGWAARATPQIGWSVGYVETPEDTWIFALNMDTRSAADLPQFKIQPNAWSGIVSIFAHVPPDLRRAVHRRVVEGLRPGGVLILEAYTPEQLRFGTGGPPVAELTMSLATLQVELDGLMFEVARECEREVFEGRYHQGRGHVVQIIGRKPVDG
ncbi:hypothetical protein [Thiocapsa imhoffii]|uniref:hypothetical protein n=1 Tax=Thiocapsa imhoffii TaxID=382777 RepID=UPI0019030524